MSESKHTPGPWHVSDERNPRIGGPRKPSLCVVSDPNHVSGIASVFCRQGMGDVDLANARLIAAAPELLEACKQLLAYVEMRLAHNGTMDVESILRELREHVPMISETAVSHHLGCAQTTRRVNLAEARAAIAKAEGRQ